MNRASDVCFTADGRRILIAEHDGAIRLVDMATGKAGGQLLKVTPLSRLFPYPDGKSFLRLDRLAGATRVELATGKITATIGPEGQSVYDVAIRPDGKLIAMARSRTEVELYDGETGKRKGTLQEIADSVAFSRDGRLFAVARSNGRLRLLRGEHLTFIDEVRVAPPDVRIQQVRFTPDGRHVVTLNANGTIYVVRIAERRKG